MDFQADFLGLDNMYDYNPATSSRRASSSSSTSTSSTGSNSSSNNNKRASTQQHHNQQYAATPALPSETHTSSKAPSSSRRHREPARIEADRTPAPPSQAGRPPRPPQKQTVRHEDLGSRSSTSAPIPIPIPRPVVKVKRDVGVRRAMDMAGFGAYMNS